MAKTKEYTNVTTYSDIFASEPYIPMLFKRDRGTNGSLRVLSLFSGCGGMDLNYIGNEKRRDSGTIQRL